MRRPVAAKTALATAGATGGTPGSPTPPGGSRLGRMYTSTKGISSIRRMGWSSKLPCSTRPWQGDLALEGGAEAESHGPFHLRGHRIGVDRQAAVDGADDAVHPHPDVAAVRSHVGGAVRGLHGRVGEEIRCFIDRFQPPARLGESGVHLAVVAHGRARIAGGGCEGRADGGAVQRGKRARFPLYGEHLPALLGGPKIVGDYRDAAGDRRYPPHAWHRLGCPGIDAHGAPAEAGAAQHDGYVHSRHLHIHAEDSTAGDLERRIQHGVRLADEAESRGGFRIACVGAGRAARAP